MSKMLQSGEVRWTLTAIDPATGEPPESAALGLLPPNNTNHVGEGYVSYTILPKAGTLITNKATIIFDNNEPIDTNPWWNKIDGAPPPALWPRCQRCLRTQASLTPGWARMTRAAPACKTASNENDFS